MEELVGGKDVVCANYLGFGAHLTFQLNCVNFVLDQDWDISAAYFKKAFISYLTLNF